MLYIQRFTYRFSGLVSAMTFFSSALCNRESFCFKKFAKFRFFCFSRHHRAMERRTDRQKERKRHSLMDSESDGRKRVRDKCERLVDFVDNNKRKREIGKRVSVCVRESE